MLRRHYHLIIIKEQRKFLGVNVLKSRKKQEARLKCRSKLPRRNVRTDIAPALRTLLFISL